MGSVRGGERGELRKQPPDGYRVLHSVRSPVDIRFISSFVGGGCTARGAVPAAQMLPTRPLQGFV